MAQVSNPKIQRLILILMLIALFALSPVKAQSQDGRPIADAGVSRYAGQNPIELDGTGSYDPDKSSPLSYTWRQIDGPTVFIVDADTATPTIGGSMQPGTGRDTKPTLSGFIQTDAIQVCEFELVVSDGELTSIPDAVVVIIVPDFGADTLRQENPPFNADKPTVIFFGGGDCVTGGGAWNSAAWAEKANIISFPSYGPDSSEDPRTYYQYGDMIIVYLSSVAPNYTQPIQTIGLSTGGQPAIDVGLRLNMVYQDARYAVNQVTFLDATPYCRSYYSESIAAFLASTVDGEQCWIDNYVSTLVGFHAAVEYSGFHPNVLNIVFERATDNSLPWLDIHVLAFSWYKNSLAGSDMNQFNNGIVGGAYWSVIGPGKNFRLASTPDVQTYKFEWYGWDSSGYMLFYDEPNHPGRLPEPVTLLAWSDALDPNDDPTGALLTCEESENAIGYELLLGPDPYHVMDYDVISDTPNPPAEIITTFPFEETWWTIRIRDQYGSTIYADPIRVNLESLPLPTIENLTNGKRYGYIQPAINEANSGDEIIVGPRAYRENISFRGKNITLRSTDPNDPVIVEATVIDGARDKSVVTFSGGEDASCVLAGFTVVGGSTGIFCRVASPTISHCLIGESGTVSIELWHGSEPTITECTIPGDTVIQPIAENLSNGKRYVRIQRAIDDAMSGDEIVLSEGTWKENIDLRGKNLVVRSTNPEDSTVVAATVLVGDDNGSLVTFTNNEDSNCVLAGITMTDAKNGIYCSAASPMIIGCNIFANRGAGILLYDGSHPIISNCVVIMNAGAGIEIQPPKVGRDIIYNCPAITNCTVFENLLYGISGGLPTITNSVIWANSPEQIINTMGTVTYSDVQSGWPGEGNIDADPLFADPSNGDYHLKSQAGRWDPSSQSWMIDDVTSPCIDAGDLTSSIGLEPSLNGGRINMGAYGGTSEASKSP